MTEINYISEIKLSSKSAYKHHVLKMCDAFSKSYKTNLFLYEEDDNFEKIKKNHLIKNNFQLQSFKKIDRPNFFFRLKYVLFVKKNLKKNSLIISRSILSSLILNTFGYKNILELHHPPTGLTKYIFYFYRLLKLDKKLKYIVISKNLKYFLNLREALILDDAVDPEDFMFPANKKIKYEFTYIGSLYDGKGIEIIDFLSKNFKEKKFYVFGDLKTLNSNKKKLLRRSNLYFMGKTEYKKIPLILSLSKYLLMPYSNKVNVNSKNLEVSQFMSPLKLFDYLASGKIIIASNLDVYSHILKNRVNSFLIDNKNQYLWRSKIKNIIDNDGIYKNFALNAKNLSKNYSWSKRVQKIIQFFND